LLSQSSVGFIGILLGFLFSINYKRKSSVLVVISIPAAFFLIYASNQNFSIRLFWNNFDSNWDKTAFDRSKRRFEKKIN
jgi:hypothetical protein